MSLSATDRQEVNDLVKLGVESYFNHYLTEVLPETLDRALSTHDHNCGAHDGAIKRMERYRWLVVGAIAGGSAGAGMGLGKLLSFLIH